MMEHLKKIVMCSILILCCACADKNLYYAEQTKYERSGPVSYSLELMDKRDWYYIDHTLFGRSDRRIPFPCNPELVDKINTNWLKHGRYDCHFYNSFVERFPKEYGECLIGLNISNVLLLLGKPNEDKNFQLEYTINSSYSLTRANYNSSMHNYRILTFTYNKIGLVTNVTLGGVMIMD